MITTTRGEYRTVRAACGILAGCMVISLTGLSSRTASANHDVPPHYTLADGNSFIHIDVDNQATVYDWFVEEPGTGIYIDHLKELSNWYRVSGAADETSVHTLTKVSQFAINTNADPRPDTLIVLYEDLANEFQIEIVFNITGGALGSGFGQLDEDITIFNMSTNSLSIHFFEYMDLDLHDTPGDDILQLTGANTGPNGFHQHDDQTDYFGSFEADRYEIDEIGPPPNTLDKFSDGSPTNLMSDLPPPPLPGSAFDPVGTNDVTWALQWNFTGNPPGIPPGFRSLIPAGGMAHIHKEGFLQMQVGIIPEPASGLLAALAGTLLLLRIRGRFLCG